MEAKFQRKLKPGKEFDKYFPPADEKDTVLKSDGDLNATIKEMANIINKYSWQSEKIAKVLADASGWHENKDLKKLCSTIFNFYYNHVQYKNDEPGKEQLRTPARLWHDREGDCDCYSLSIGCILSVLGIPFTMRITKYFADWQHVYIVVPDPANGAKYVVDCVLDTFNYEKPYGAMGDFDPAAKLDIHIKPKAMGLNGIPIMMLSGADNNENVGNFLSTQKELKQLVMARIAMLKRKAIRTRLSAEGKNEIKNRIAVAESFLSTLAGIDYDDDMDRLDYVEDSLDGIEETIEILGGFDDDEIELDGPRKVVRKAKRQQKRVANKKKRVVKARARKLKRVAKRAERKAAKQFVPDNTFEDKLQLIDDKVEKQSAAINESEQNLQPEMAEEMLDDSNNEMDNISNEMLDSGADQDDIDEANEEFELEEDPADVLDGLLGGADFDNVYASLDDCGLCGADDEIELGKLPLKVQHDWLNANKKHLRKTRNYIRRYPSSVASNGGAKLHLAMLDYALKNWDNPQAREKALAHLEKEELRLSIQGVFGDADADGLDGVYYPDDTIDGLDGKKKNRAKFWKKTGEAGKKIFKGAQKYNPLMVAARNGFLLAAKLNFFGISRKMYPGFMPWEEAKAAGLSQSSWEKKVKAANKFAKVWENTLGGKKSKLVQALKNGWNKKAHFRPAIKVKTLGWVSFYGLGDPAVIAASITAGTAVLITAAQIFKDGDANAMPPGDVTYPEDVIETANAVDGTDSDGYSLLGAYASEAEISGIGDKAARQAKRAAKQQQRVANKAVRKSKSTATKAERKGTKEAKKSQKNTSTKITNAGERIVQAGGMVSAANALYQNATGKSLIPGGADEFISDPAKFFTPKEMKDLEANDPKMKAQEAGMGSATTWLIGGVVATAIGVAVFGGGKDKATKSTASLNGTPRKLPAKRKVEW